MIAWLIACNPAAPPPVAPAMVVHDPDANQLAQVALGRRHRVTHILAFFAPDSADAAAVALSAQGLAVQAESEGEAWTVHAAEEVLLTEPWVRQRRVSMEALATGYGGTYEGWEAEVQR